MNKIFLLLAISVTIYSCKKNPSVNPYIATKVTQAQIDSVQKDSTLLKNFTQIVDSNYLSLSLGFDLKITEPDGTIYTKSKNHTYSLTDPNLPIGISDTNTSVPSCPYFFSFMGASKDVINMGDTAMMYYGSYVYDYPTTEHLNAVLTYLPVGYRYDIDWDYFICDSVKLVKSYSYTAAQAYYLNNRFGVNTFKAGVFGEFYLCSIRFIYRNAILDTEYLYTTKVIVYREY